MNSKHVMKINQEKMIDYIINQKELLDSRILAGFLGKDHKDMQQLISRHKGLLETESTLLQKSEARKHATGAVVIKYYMLNRIQMLIVAGLIRAGEDKNALIFSLSKAFVEAHDRISALEKRVQELADADMKIEMSEYTAEEKLNQILGRDDK